MLCRLILLLALTLNASLAFAQPANDDVCDATQVIADGSCATGTTIDATPDIDDPGCTENTGASVWFETTITDGNDTLQIDLTNISVPGNEIVSVNVFTIDSDCNGSPLPFPGGEFCGSFSGASLTLLNVVPGTTYYVQVITVPFETGDFEICFEEFGPLVCPATTTCDDPEVIALEPPSLSICIIGCLQGADPGPVSSQDSCFKMPNETVWYEITLPSIVPPSSLPAFATITVTTVGLDPFENFPQLAVYQDCVDLNQVACDFGELSHLDANWPTGPVEAYGVASVSFPVQDFEENDPFLIAVSYIPGADIPEFFELCVSVGTLCNEESEIEVVSTSLGSPLDGPYAPGEEVEVCLRINNWNSGTTSTNCNFLHGLVPQFGDCWDPSSFGPDGEPVNITQPMTNITNFGNWDWFDESAVAYNNWVSPGYLPPGALVGAGWFYIRNPGEIPQCTNYNNPNCSRGDGNQCDDELPIQWDVCFVLTTKSFPECDLEENMACDISFRTFGDGETGGYMQVGCIFDTVWTIDLALECCEQPFFEPVITQFNCSEVEIVIDLESNLDPDVEYVWDVSDNDVGATACPGGCPTSIEQTLVNSTNLPVTVTYIVTPTTISEGCVGDPFPIDVEINPQLAAYIPSWPAICEGSCVTLNVAVNGGEPPYFYWWDGIGSANSPNVCPTDTTDYFLTVTDGNGCTTTATTTVFTTPILTVDIRTEPNTDNICENDPDFPIELTAEVTEGGSGFYVWAWGTGEFTQTIEAPETATYCITVIDALTQCSGEMCQTITVHPAPEPAIEDPGVLCDAAASVCLSAEPDGGEWLSDTIFISSAGCVNPSNIGPGIFEVCYAYTDPETGCDSTTCIDLQIIGAPIFDRINDTISCDAFTLPSITGINLSGSAAYYTGPDSAGTMYLPGDQITSTQQIFMYENVGDGICITQDSFNITIYETPNANFDVQSPVCIGDTSIINYSGDASAFATFTWDFGSAVYVNGTGAGPYEVLWDAVGSHDVTLIVNDRDCITEENIENVVVEQLMSQPVVSCQTTTTEIEFSWSDVPGATGYAINVLSGHAGVQNGNTFLVTGLMPMEQVTIEVLALSDGVCGSSITTVTCSAIDCPVITVDIDPVGDICLNGLNTPINLNAIVTGSDGSGTGEWVGLFTTPDGIFDPLAAGPGSYLIGYNFNEVACNYSASTQIMVFESPNASFSLETEICEDNFATLMYEGNAAISANFMWDFDGGNVTNGTGGVGPGPHEIVWITAGVKVVSLTVEENGCFSNMQLENIDVISTLAIPFIDCTSTTEEIIFSWADIAGSSGYNVTLINGNPGVINGNTYTISNLDPEESVTIQIEAISGGPCPSTLSLETLCMTEACALPQLTMDIPTDTICLDSGSQPIDLDIIFDPDPPSGTGQWFGIGIIDSDLGIFDPQTAGLGQHNITFDYSELNCANSIDDIIRIFEIPVVNFIATDTICITEIADVTFLDGNISGNFNWDFGGGNIVSGAGSGPFEIDWNSPGDKMISLILERNSCESQLVSFPVYVEDTLGNLTIDCVENYEDISFSWNALSGITEYQVYINNVLVSTQTGTSYVVDGLQPDELVNIEVVAVNAGRCANKAFASFCTTSNCPPIDIIITPGDTSLCLTSSTSPFNLDSIIIGGLGSGNGIGTWNGAGTTVDEGIFDPQAAGIGMHEIIFSYDELDCLADASIFIEVVQQPVADFAVTNRICVEDTATINFQGIAGGSAVFDWDLLGGNIEQINATTYNVWWDSPGTYDISLVVNDNGCDSEQRFNQIIVEPSLDAPVIDCITTSESIDFSWNSVDCATQYEVYIDIGNGLMLVATQTNTDYNLNGLDPETVVDIEIVALSDCACPSVSTLNTCSASACPSVDVDITEVMPFCVSSITDPFQLDATILGGTGNGTVLWSGTGVNPVGLFDPGIVGTGISQVTIEYTEINCSFTDQINIEIFEEPSATFEISDPSCFGENDGGIIVNATGGDSNYSYFLNNSPSGSNQFMDLGPGNYTVSVVDGNNCRFDQNIQIFDALNPSIDVDGPFVIFVGNTGTFTLNTNIPSASITNIIWEENNIIICEGCTEMDVSPELDAEYCVTIEYDNGCSVNTCVDLRVDIEKNIYTPNVFSPNGDGINDYFTIYTNNLAQQINYLKIFDRWGEMVFETENIPTDDEGLGWDGRFNGESLNPGVYVFVAELMYSPTDFEIVTGDITLLK